MAKSKAEGPIVSIKERRKAVSEKESAYLLRSEAMKGRLLAAKLRTEGIPLAEVREKLGI